MNESEKKRDKFWAFYEKHYPLVVAALVAGVYYFADIEFMDSFEDLLSASMSFASILIGFLGVLIALLFSLNNNAIRNYIFKDDKYKRKMYSFFQVPIISGFLFVVLSLSLYLRKTIAQIECLKKIITSLQEFINIAWVFCLVFFISSSYRLIKLVLQIAFFESTDEETAENEELEYDVEEYNKVKEEYAITKDKQDDSWE